MLSMFSEKTCWNWRHGRHAGLLAVCCWLLVSSAFAQDDVPPVGEFLRRVGSAGCVLGDYVYFDGGVITQENPNLDGWTRPVNTTLSIDISQSWRPEDVEIRNISRPSWPTSRQGPPVMVRQYAFANEQAERFYIWGGTRAATDQGILNDEELPPPMLWRFDANGEGGGQWTTDAPSDPDTFADLQRTQFAAYVTTPGAGFVFGGQSDEYTEEDPVGDVQGYLSFNMTTKTWANHTAVPYSPDGSLYGSSATYVPGFGPNGVVMLLGGGSRWERSVWSYVDPRVVHFMDPVTGEWFNQTTTGDIPQSRHGPCTVGVASDDTYDIFMFGGSNRLEDADLGDVYVLSLPGFHWTKAAEDNEDLARADAACLVIGNRHLMSWGGMPTAGFFDPDPFPQGIGLFDVSRHEWVDEYDADADEYVPHESIREWYEEGGLDSVEWDYQEARALFLSDDDDGTDEDKEEEDDADEAEDEPTETSSTPVGAIAGGVVGGVGAIALAGAATLFFLRRRRKQREKQAARKCGGGNDMDDGESSMKMYGYDAHSPENTQGYSPPSELNGTPSRAELSDQGYAELSAEGTAELSTEGYRESWTPSPETRQKIRKMEGGGNNDGLR